MKVSRAPNGTTASTPRPAAAHNRDWVAPQQQRPWYDDVPVERRRQLPPETFGAFLHSGERLRGWHFVDGSAQRLGLLHHFAHADVDIASLFALPHTAAQLTAAERAILHRPVQPPVRGRLDDVFFARLPLAVARRELTALVTDDMVADFLESHPAPGLHVDPHDVFALDRALQADLHGQLQARGLAGPALAAAFAKGAERSSVDDPLRSVVREQFIASLLSLLDLQSPSVGCIDQALVGASYREDATRLVRLLAVRARERDVEGPPPALAELCRLAAADGAKPLRRQLTEALLAAAAPTTAVQARVKIAPSDPFTMALFDDVKDLPSWRRRDTDAAVTEALTRLLQRHARDGVVALNDLAGATSATAIDVVLALRRDAHTTSLMQPALVRSDGAHAPLHYALAAIPDEGRARRNLILDREAAAHRLDAWRANPDRSADPPSRLEQELVATGPRLSLAALATTLSRRPACVMTLLPLIRTQDALALFMSTAAFPEDMLGPKTAAFFTDLSSALDAAGGGTPALDLAVFPQALLEFLSPLADAHGAVAWRDVRDQYGPAPALWFASVAEGINAGVLGDASPAHALTHVPSGLSERAVTAIGRGLPDISMRDRMQGLDAVLDKVGDPQALAGFDVVLTQHLFPSTLGLLSVLGGQGLSLDRLHVLGKSYSTHERTYAAARALNFNVDKTARQDNDIAQDANARLAEAARRTLRRLFDAVSTAERENKSSPKRYILFDEGGKLHEVLHREFSAYAHLCVSVEHTDHGMQLRDAMEAEGHALALAVVDMARCHAKKLFESPCIGESVMFHTDALLEALGVAPRSKQATVIGYGAVGKATADALRRRHYVVTVHDIDDAALVRAHADGCKVTKGDTDQRRREALKNAHLLISATGRTTLRPDEFAGLLPDGAILVNAASGTHEFGVGDLGDEALTLATRGEALSEDGTATTTFRGQAIATGPYAAAGKHRHLVFAQRDQDGRETEQLLLRGGAVVNMLFGMPPEVVQLTLGLVVLSILQAARMARDPELPATRHSLNAEWQSALVTAVEDDLRAKGLPPLSAPDFRTVKPWA